MGNLRSLLAGTAALLVLTLPRFAEAQDKLLSRDSPSFYLYASPAFIGVPLGDDVVTATVDVSYQWGIGLGGLFALADSRKFGANLASIGSEIGFAPVLSSTRR